MQWFVDFEFPNAEGNPYKSSGGEMIGSEMGDIPKGWRL
jgi:type I restriction enzyme S subunit